MPSYCATFSGSLSHGPSSGRSHGAIAPDTLRSRVTCTMTCPSAFAHSADRWSWVAMPVISSGRARSFLDMRDSRAATIHRSPLVCSAASLMSVSPVPCSVTCAYDVITSYLLDLTIVNVAIPTLGAGLHASIPAVQWVLTGYMLAFAAVIPLTGWAGEHFGAKRAWLAALGLFLGASVLAAVAWSIASLIAFRVLQGLGAGMILPVGQTILAQAAGPQRMGRVMSVIGVPLLLAPVFGPVLGGAIIGAASWRLIFLINLPIGAAAVLAAWRLLPEARPHLGQRLDLPA